MSALTRKVGNKNCSISSLPILKIKQKIYVLTRTKSHPLVSQTLLKSNGSVEHQPFLQWRKNVRFEVHEGSVEC